jgi:hypothetical protein
MGLRAAVEDEQVYFGDMSEAPLKRAITSCDAEGVEQASDAMIAIRVFTDSQ